MSFCCRLGQFRNMSTRGVLNTGAGWFSELPDLITICVLYHITDSLAYKGQVFSYQDTAIWRRKLNEENDSRQLDNP